MKTIISTDIKLSSKMRNRIKHEIHKHQGKNVQKMHKIQNNIYTEHESESEKIKIFTDIISSDSYYIFSVIHTRKKQTFFVLANINTPMPFSKNEDILYPAKDEKIIIHVKQ